jgi:hypothetical protein
VRGCSFAAAALSFPLVTLLEQIKELAAEAEKPGHNLMLGSKILAIVASLNSEPKPDVTAEMFEAMGPELRFIAMNGFCLLLIQSMDK